MKLDGIVAVVTGAASGIGEALARQLHAKGARLVICDIQAAPLQALAAALPGSLARVVDVSSREAVFALAAEVEATLGGASLLINNAGLTVVGAFEDHSTADWERVMGVNFGGVLYGCQAFLPQLQRQREGWIVNISSIFGIVGVPGQSAYCASKFAVRGLSEALAEELRGTSVGLTVVHPGGVRTNIVNQARVGEGVSHGALSKRFAKLGMSPMRAAGMILSAVEAGQRRLRVGPDAIVMDWARRLFPEWGNEMAVELMGRAMGLPRRLLEARRAERGGGGAG